MRTIIVGGFMACTLLAACEKKPAEAPAPAAPAATAAATPTTPASTAKPPVGSKVSFAGCPAKGVEATCIMLDSGGTTYNLTSAEPKIEIKGLGVNGEGVVSDGVSICNQGVLLKDITYTYNKMKCPL